MITKLDLTTEIVLDPAIQFQDLQPAHWTNPRAVFLTGATGFVGVHLLAELLQQTTADIYCLVRAKPAEANEERLRKHLQAYLLWQAPFGSRIIPVTGDLSKPYLGLTPYQFDELAHLVEIIYHNAAQVNSLYSYSQLKATNVLGTQEILRLASRGCLKPVHFVSSLAIFFGPSCPSVASEMGIPEASLTGGYKQSKWVAEQLIRLAHQRGLPACIYRPARIVGHSKIQVMNNFKDLFCSFLKACVLLRKCPTLQATLNLVPVDYVTQALIYLSRQATSLNKTFHLCNPQPIAWSSLFNHLRACGCFLEEVDYPRWLNELSQRAPGHRFYSSLSLLLRSPNNLLTNNPQFEASHTLAGLAGTSISCPSVEETLLATGCTYLQKCGYFSDT